MDELRKNLEERILGCDKVIIVPHLNADFDAIASSIGIYLIAKRFKKNSFIIFDDQINNIDSGVKQIIMEAKDEYNIIDKKKYDSIATENDLIILSDVNKSYLTCEMDYSKIKDRTIIIDHHETGKGSVESSYSYIDLNSSSTSEIITLLLGLYKCKIPSDVANYLYAGIYLDTAKLTKNVTYNTFNAASKLLSSGASIDKVNSLFKEEFYSDRRIQDLISNGTKFDTYTLAYALGEEDAMYTKIELAKAADYLLKFGADVTFTIGKVGDDISISARSNNRVDVGKIMEKLGGGGRVDAASANFNEPNLSIQQVGKKLMRTLKPFYIVNNNEEEEE